MCIHPLIRAKQKPFNWKFLVDLQVHSVAKNQAWRFSINKNRVSRALTTTKFGVQSLCCASVLLDRIVRKFLEKDVNHSSKSYYALFWQLSRGKTQTWTDFSEDNTQNLDKRVAIVSKNNLLSLLTILRKPNWSRWKSLFSSIVPSNTYHLYISLCRTIEQYIPRQKVEIWANFHTSSNEPNEKRIISRLLFSNIFLALVDKVSIKQESHSFSVKSTFSRKEREMIFNPKGIGHKISFIQNKRDVSGPLFIHLYWHFLNLSSLDLVWLKRRHNVRPI